MTDKSSPATAPDEAAKHEIGLPTIIVAGLFGLLYAYDLWESISGIVAVPARYAAIGFAGTTPWILLIAALAFPLVIFVAAFLIGLRRNIGEKALLYITGLAVSNALALSTIGPELLIYSNLIDPH